MFSGFCKNKLKCNDIFHGFSWFFIVFLWFFIVFSWFFMKLDFKELDFKELGSQRTGFQRTGYPLIFIDGYPSMNINGYPSMNIIDGYPSMNMVPSFWAPWGHMIPPLLQKDRRTTRIDSTHHVSKFSLHQIPINPRLLSQLVVSTLLVDKNSLNSSEPSLKFVWLPQFL